MSANGPEQYRLQIFEKKAEKQKNIQFINTTVFTLLTEKEKIALVNSAGVFFNISRNSGRLKLPLPDNIFKAILAWAAGTGDSPCY